MMAYLRFCLYDGDIAWLTDQVAEGENAYQEYIAGREGADNFKFAGLNIVDLELELKLHETIAAMF